MKSIKFSLGQKVILNERGKLDYVKWYPDLSKPDIFGIIQRQNSQLEENGHALYTVRWFAGEMIIQELQMWSHYFQPKDNIFAPNHHLTSIFTNMMPNFQFDKKMEKV
jgi:hypothetical protein